METDQKSALTSVIAWAVASIPFATMAVFLVYGLSARAEIGYWPVTYRDNVPISLQLIDQVAGVSLLICFWSLLVGLIAAFLVFFRAFRSRFWRPVSAYWLGVFVFYAIIWIAPFGFIDWFLD